MSGANSGITTVTGIPGVCRGTRAEGMVARGGGDDAQPAACGRQPQQRVAGPLSLKDPVRWKLSSLHTIRDPVISLSGIDSGQASG